MFATTPMFLIRSSWSSRNICKINEFKKYKWGSRYIQGIILIVEINKSFLNEQTWQWVRIGRFSGETPAYSMPLRAKSAAASPIAWISRRKPSAVAAEASLLNSSWKKHSRIPYGKNNFRRSTNHSNCHMVYHSYHRLQSCGVWWYWVVLKAHTSPFPPWT